MHMSPVTPHGMGYNIEDKFLSGNNTESNLFNAWNGSKKQDIKYLKS